MSNLRWSNSSVSKHFYKNGESVVITQGFWNTDPSYPFKPHTGYDYRAQSDLELVAPMDGVVINASVNNDTWGYGNYVLLYLPILDMTFHVAHLKHPHRVKTGQVVKKGDVIGVTGTTGNIIGRHLHAGIRKGKSLNIEKDQPWVDLEKINFNLKAPIVNRVAQDGYFKVDVSNVVPKVERLNIRDSHSTSAKVVGSLNNGDEIRYDSFIVSGGYHWVSWLRDGVRVYAAWRVQDGIKYGACRFATTVAPLKVGDTVKIKDKFVTYEGSAKGKLVSSYALNQVCTINKIENGNARLTPINSWVRVVDLVRA